MLAASIHTISQVISAVAAQVSHLVAMLPVDLPPPLN